MDKPPPHVGITIRFALSNPAKDHSQNFPDQKEIFQYLRLVSKPGEYISRVAFLYPDDQPLQWKLFLEQQAKEHKEHVDFSRISQTGNVAVDKLYFDYTRLATVVAEFAC